jgi:predicted N-formylglutamate amidohydrolase
LTPILVLTCEHGGNDVPAAYTHLFKSRSAADALASHRGMDAGALRLATVLARRLRAPLTASRVSRLLVDLNRSPGHPKLFSEFVLFVGAEGRERILSRYYFPHRQRVAASIAAAIARSGCVLHVAIHSFAPRLGGQVRRADLGLLYDPARSAERVVCARWQALLRREAGQLRVRRNYPYRGTADGLTTSLRKAWAPGRYVGVELEVNQQSLRRAAALIAGALANSLEQLLSAWPASQAQCK